MINEGILANYIWPNFNLNSRLYQINTELEDVNIYLKRDDELSGIVSGSKNRKISSIIYFVKKNNIKNVCLSGSAKSNNVLALIQILKSYQIEIMAYLKSEYQFEGNSILIQTLLNKNEVVFISQKDWPNVNIIMNNYKAKRKDTMVIPEGSTIAESIPGAMSLSSDLVRNLNDSNITADHIFIDAGTCWQSLALWHGLNKRNISTNIHIVQMAGDEKYFHTQNNLITQLCKAKFSVQLNHKFNLPMLYSSETARSYGSTNQTLFNFIKSFAKQYGILLEPIYSAKLMHTAIYQIKKQKLKGNIIIIISGSPMSFIGFENRLLK